MKAGLAAEVLNYPAIPTGSGRKAVLHSEFRCVNTVLSNLKTALSGTYPAFTNLFQSNVIILCNVL